jgi:hypothetical protein
MRSWPGRLALPKAVEETTQLDRPRLLLLVHHMVVKGSNRYYSETQEVWASSWWLNKLGLKRETVNDEGDRVVKALEKWSDLKILQAIVECALQTLRYSGEIQHYKIATKDLLAGLGVKIPPIVAVTNI